ncbi:hypothetical protein R0131_03200 [Clostridium sp. AL.422]|uniref:hypothetical protein n=1 Tax=Clostridium TaxID=1485 RepID=UPI00293DB311|nr:MULTISPECIES: hypothetical protein [unclassified Clostridium]MDV4149835.1 hypothetical protein [Clostridium sp. AL.422]
MEKVIDKTSNNSTITPLNFEQEIIIEWIKKVQFKKKFLGGVSEEDVWKKITELNNMYTMALVAERERYDALLEEHGILHRESIFSNEIYTSVEEA